MFFSDFFIIVKSIKSLNIKISRKFFSTIIILEEKKEEKLVFYLHFIKFLGTLRRKKITQ